MKDKLRCSVCSSENIKKSTRERPVWGYNGDSLIWWECLECDTHFAQGDWWPEDHEVIDNPTEGG